MHRSVLINFNGHHIVAHYTLWRMSRCLWLNGYRQKGGVAGSAVVNEPTQLFLPHPAQHYDNEHARPQGLELSGLLYTPRGRRPQHIWGAVAGDVDSYIAAAVPSGRTTDGGR